MAKDLLLELGMEEIPARFIRQAMEQLKERTAKWLNDSRIEFEQVQAYAAPRRIAVLVGGVAEKQQDVREEVKGPSKKIALDENGGWSKAALGFARSQGVDPEQFYFKELGGVEYIYANKSRIGTETFSALSDGLMQIITAMNFPKNMRWGGYEFKFVRPIRWIVSLFGDQVVPMEICGVRSGNVTRGHRFLGGETAIAQPSEYVERLREQFVIADVEERERLIVGQITALSEDKGWKIAVKDDLLEEVLFLVEYPTVLFGTFDPAFLHIPQEVLITSMREHQRYFPVLDDGGKLLPYFVTVRNGDAKSLDLVAKGNEKVLRARLSDAKFFYEEDQKLAIADALAKLDSIVFHEELGTIGDKVRRIRAIADRLAGLLHADEETARYVSRTADICKFDLVTQMVYEFPELQGVMGEDYARKAGEPEQVARAIFEHYQPRFAADGTPASLTGAIVSIGDKIDTIVGCFSLGMIPTGSQDPYALRRQAAGIVQIMLDRKMACLLSELFELALQVHEASGLLKRSADEVRKDLYEFFGLRVKNVLSDTVRYDVVDAVMAAGFDDIAQTVLRGQYLMQAVTGQSDFKTTVDSFNRVNNLAAKSTGAAEANPALFAHAAEKRLYEKAIDVRSRYKEALAAGDIGKALAELSSLKQPITEYFDHVMVMDENEAVRANRLATLAGIAADLQTFADFSKLVW
ncbi:glycine--tRNA ligase subunit beta [Paenibacillus sp. MSJ-34]|uniref:glycine--tRNA ligase subunit beta n=1 Tax=Paenibacillus sp. MSJ-34 TaxID=2841529 RepID=UPI001C0F7123|nr:glycine--tRNA ligase subunit beta [Paenibacillus sp. MSJ-34]MBU5440471.1 glycine--tRNA ligase subunit beta [Paenibacillus sp. MSJ-34]